MNNGLNTRLHKLFETGSIIYLALPLMLFAFGWLKLYFAIPVVGVILYLIWKTHQLPSSKAVVLFNFKKYRLLLAISGVILFAWVIVSGAGGLTTQSMDYNKHNAVLNDLVSKDWPVIYTTPAGEEKPLVYYIAYYLPAALTGKLLHSETAANIAQLVWLFIGILLIYYWLLRLLPRPSYLALGLLILFSGMDIIGHLLIQTHDSTYALIERGSKLEWYTGLGNMQYSANTTLLFWVPQHATVGWLTAALILALVVERKSKRTIMFIFSLSLLWSPLVSIGLVPLIIAAWVVNKFHLKEFITPENILSVLFICIPIGLYLISSSTPQPGGLFTQYSSESIDTFQKILRLSIFALVEFVILCALIAPFVLKRLSKEWKIMFITAVVTLLLLPFFRYGIFNDLSLRASIPSLFIVMVTVGYFLLHKSHASFSKTKAAVLMVLAVGIIVPLAELNIHTISPNKSLSELGMEIWTSIGNENISEGEKRFTAQYLGDRSKPFFVYLSR